MKENNNISEEKEGRKLSDKEINQLNDILSKEKPLKIPDYEEEKGYAKEMKTVLDPNTGETKIIGSVDQDETVDDEDFETFLKNIDDNINNIEVNDSPISTDELKDTIQEDFDNKDFDLSDEALQELLKIVNRKKKGEKFNIYKESPDEVKDMIDSFVNKLGIANGTVISNQARAIRNDIAETLIDQFISNIQINRAKTDLNKEIENIFKESTQELTEYVVGYTEERNKKYREYANNLTDIDKKKKLNDILDVIDSAYSLNNLKEFAKTCKIKNYDIENPNKYFTGFISKYKNSPYNIYDIKLTIPILERRFVDDDTVNTNSIIALLVCFCKYVLNYDIENPYEHSFMYYFIYNIIVIDSNKSDATKSVSDKFVNNIKDVIINLKERNPKLN